MTGAPFVAQAALSAPRFPVRRGACPSLVKPMPTGDGLLARLRPMATGFSPAQWITIADLARSFGNGLLEVTARGSLQIRGLSPRSAPHLASAFHEAGLLVRSGVVVETPPLSGLDAREIADATELADRIRQAIEEHQPALRLAPKLSIVVNGGGRLNLSTMAADLRLDAVSNEDEIAWRIAVAGDAFSATPIGMLPEAKAVETILHLLETLSAKGPAARGRDIVDTISPASAPSCAEATFAEPVPPVGPIAMNGISVLGSRLAYGRMHADDLEGLMAGLAELGATEVRLAPDHALLILGLSAEATKAAVDLARVRGFLTDPTDPANSISACPGTGFCAAARLNTRLAAEALIASAPSLLDGSCQIHVSGCSKGCAHPAAAPLTLVGTEQGVGIIIAGRAGDPAEGPFDPDDLHSLFSRLESFIRRHRRPGETARSLLGRFGASAFTAIFKGRT